MMAAIGHEPRSQKNTVWMAALHASSGRMLPHYVLVYKKNPTLLLLYRRDQKFKTSGTRRH